MTIQSIASGAARSLLALLLSCSMLHAQETAPEAAAAEPPPDPVWTAAMEAMVVGPNKIDLIDQAQFSVPEGYGFVPRAQAKPVMEKMGNQTDDRFLGLVFPMQDGAAWFVSVEFEPSGYVKDDDAKHWDADELLESLKEGTEQANEHRESVGVAPIEVTRWVETPAYDAPTHRLVWSAEAREKGGNDPDPTINYNTYVLGREGYISMNLITSSSHIEQDKPAARELLAAVGFVDGKRYEDFNASTDKVAAYGLAALVGGIAAKKLGLLAMAAAFFAKFAKLIIVGVAALGGGVAKFFRRKPAEEG
jgi:uncharacterized membrane-anchored protein